MLLQSLVDTIEQLKARLTAHGEHLKSNEIRTRMALVDPMLAVLGWDPADPSLVVPEYNPQGGRDRADYALMRPDGHPIAILEAKKLGESFETHLKQMTSYANMAGIAYAGLTDGNVWELYSVFEQKPIGDRCIMKISMSNDPIHEIAIRMLVLWRSNLESGKAQLASEPIFLKSNSDSPVISRPHDIGQNENSVAAVSSNWVSIEQVIPISKQDPPKAMRLPDGKEISVKYWGDILTQTAVWLSDKGYLNQNDMPIPSSKKRYIANSEALHPSGNRFIGTFQVPNSGIFVEKNVSAPRAVEHAKRLLKCCNQSAEQFHLKMG